MTARFRLKPGTYLIVPSTYEPGSTCKILLEKPVQKCMKPMQQCVNWFPNNLPPPRFRGSVPAPDIYGEAKRKPSAVIVCQRQKRQVCQNKISLYEQSDVWNFLERDWVQRTITSVTKTWTWAKNPPLSRAKPPNFFSPPFLTGIHTFWVSFSNPSSKKLRK